MAKQYFTDEQKTDFIVAIQLYLDKGWSFNSTYKQVKADFEDAGKSTPSYETARRWFTSAQRYIKKRRAMNPTDTEPIGPGEPEPEGPEGQPGESPDTDDYTHRLELIVKLYRTRSEAACDAVCDRLLPELYADEEG